MVSTKEAGPDTVKPGIYDQMSFEDYLAIPALSNTAMGSLVKSPYHYKHARPLERQKYLVLGELVHASRLEPAEFEKRYSVMPAFEKDEGNLTVKGDRSFKKTTKYYETKSREFAESEASTGRIVVPMDWYLEHLEIVGSLFADDEANRLFNEAGPFELTLVWEDPETGILCKGRMDKCCMTGRFGDLKTTADILKFPRSFSDYDYARQMAHYQTGYAILTNGELLTPWISAVEKTAPYCVHTAPVDEDSMDWGRAEQVRLLRLLEECHVKETWPGPELPREWRVNEWKLQQGEVSLTIGGQKVEV